MRTTLRSLKLLNENAKTKKPVLHPISGKPIAVVGLSLSPHAKGGYNVCPEATIGCISSCNLWFAGRTRFETARNAMNNRKKLLFENPPLFYRHLDHDLDLFTDYCQTMGYFPCVRMNAASDLDWGFIADERENLTFYDYSKVRSRFEAYVPVNYSLTYSWNERSTTEFARSVLDSGRNVSIVFDVPYFPQSNVFGYLPEFVDVNGKRFHVVDGDIHDVRLTVLDGSGVIVGLRLKGTNDAKRQAIVRRFAVPVPFPRFACDKLGGVIPGSVVAL